MNRWEEWIPALRPDGSHVPEGVGRLVFVLLAAYLLVLPTAGTVALRNLLFFSALLLTLFAAVRWKLKLQIPFALPWIVYAAVALASLVRAIDPAYSLGEIKAEILYGIIATMLAGTWLTRIDTIHKLLTVLISGSAVMALVACWQALRDSWLHIAFDAARIGALHSGVGDYSTYIVVVMPFLLGTLWYYRASRHIRLALAAVIALNILGAAITRNRATFPALAIEAVLFAFLVARVDRDWLRRRRAGLWIGLSLLGVAALFVAQIVLRIHADPTSGTFDQDPRWEIWARALDNIRTGPWSGSGFGRGVFTRLNPDVVARNGLHWHAHNTWLNKGVQMGFPGIAAFALLLVAAAWRAWLPRAAIRSDPGAGMLSASGIALLAGLFVKNMTDDFFVRDQGYLFWVLMAAIAAALEPLRRASHAPGNSVAVQNR